MTPAAVAAAARLAVLTAGRARSLRDLDAPLGHYREACMYYGQWSASLHLEPGAEPFRTGPGSLARLETCDRVIQAAHRAIIRAAARVALSGSR